MLAKTYPSKKLQSINLPATDITIDTVQLEDTHIVYEITATIGALVYKERHAIGAQGGGPLLTGPQLQTALDGFRQQVADNAAWQAAMSALQAGIV